MRRHLADTMRLTAQPADPWCYTVRLTAQPAWTAHPRRDAVRLTVQSTRPHHRAHHDGHDPRRASHHRRMLEAIR